MFRVRTPNRQRREKKRNPDSGCRFRICGLLRIFRDLCFEPFVALIAEVMNRLRPEVAVNRVRT